MRVSDLMHHEVRTLHPDATVADAIVALTDSHVTGLPIVDRHGLLLGVLSTSDVLEAEAEAGDAQARTAVLEDTRVSDLMTPRPITVTPETSVQEAARQMLYADVKRLFVAQDGRLVGVISQTDIVGAVANGHL
jgi:CBS domain-containing protein